LGVRPGVEDQDRGRAEADVAVVFVELLDDQPLRQRRSEPSFFRVTRLFVCPDTDTPTGP
jgi:hypothetical protein